MTLSEANTLTEASELTFPLTLTEVYKGPRRKGFNPKPASFLIRTDGYNCLTKSSTRLG